MLSKPSVFGRNDPVVRRETQSVLSNTARTPMPVLTNSTAPDKAVAANQSTVSTPPKTGGDDLATKAGESPMEARLIVGPDVKLKGAEILDCDTLVVEGRVEATMDSRVIRIAEKGYFSGKVSIDIAEIHGCFEGELTVRSQLVIHSTGRVSGTIRFGKLVVEEGGQLCGDVNMITEKSAAPSSAFSESLSRPAAAVA